MKTGYRREPALMLLYTILTCGIYYFTFIYRVSEEVINFQGKSDYSPGTEVLLSILTCGLWIYFWDYRIGKRIAEMNATVGLPPVDNSILFIVLNLLGHPIFGVGMVNALIQQDSLNRIWEAAGTTQ